MRDFKKLIIWQKAMDVVSGVYQAVESFPKEEPYGLRSQVTRCAVSIAANIAEGNAKSSEKEKKLYMERSSGSAYELETHMLIIERLKWLEEQRGERNFEINRRGATNALIVHR
jgi:four helix bundle protein